MNNAKSSKPFHDALMFMTVSDVEVALKDISILQDACEELFQALSLQIHPTLSKLYNETVSDLYRSSLTASLQKKKKSGQKTESKTRPQKAKKVGLADLTWKTPGAKTKEK